MPIDWGPVFTKWGEIAYKVLVAACAKAAEGKRGPSAQEKEAEKNMAYIEDELIGKVGPIVDVYDPEGTNRMVGEW